MTSLALFHGMRDFAEMLLGGRARTEPSRSGVESRPQSEDERHGMIEEMLLINPAICASEFGVQWMYTKYGRY